MIAFVLILQYFEQALLIFASDAVEFWFNSVSFAAVHQSRESFIYDRGQIFVHLNLN